MKKSDNLSPEELDTIKPHAVKGAEIIEKVGALKHLAPIIRGHHEKYDGSGYPNQLIGEAIPLSARIVAVADVFDALTSRRPYKEAWDNERAFETLRKMAGEQLDNDCVDALLSQQDAIETIQQQFRENIYG